MAVLPLRHIDERRRRHADELARLEDAVLLDRFVGGDDEAFLEMFRRHNPRLVTYAARILTDGERGEDAVQEAWEKLIQLRVTRENLRNPLGFLLRVVRNRCIDNLRAARHHASLDDLHEASHPVADNSDRSELEEIAVAELDKLPYDMREVLVLNLYSGYRFEEIAVMLGKSPEAIWARASRARARLRTAVARAIEHNSKESE